MAFSTLRGRPRATTRVIDTDSGTPELRLKHAMGITAEPIDLCLSRGLITPDQHWCGLHLRWLYTLRYGAPVTTSRYMDRLDCQPAAEQDENWRQMREQEYHDSIALLKSQRRYEPVMRLCVFNELPAFLNHSLKERAWSDPALAHQLLRSHHSLREGLDILVKHWRRNKNARCSPSPS